MELRPISYLDACYYIDKHHRHHKAPQGHKFSISAIHNNEIIGVIIVGRPIGRHDDDGLTLEVTRLCTKGTKNTCSFLYSAAWRVSKNLGYKKLITFILDTETGTSLRAAGYKIIGQAGGLSWNNKSRPRIDKSPNQYKIRYEIQ